MIIVNQDCRSILNADNVVRIYVEDNRILSKLFDCTVTCLANYGKQKRAEEVFEKMLSECFMSDAALFINVQPTKEVEEILKNRGFGIMAQTPDDKPSVNVLSGVYYMPEE